MLHFFFVAGLLSIVGSRVASLVMLEFCLRAVSGWVTAGPVRNQIYDKDLTITRFPYHIALDFFFPLIFFCHVIMAHGLNCN